MRFKLQLVRVLVPQLLVVLLFIVYVVTGSMVFVLLDENIANETFTEVLLFSFTTLTTIGYGNISPATNSSQLFCIVFSIAGIPMALLTLANLGKYLTKVYWLMLVCFGKNIKWRACQNANMPLPTTITLLIVTFAFGSFFFYETGRGFTVDDIYFSVISFSTVGFGDRKPTADNPWMLVGMVVYLIWGMILMTTLFAAISVYLRAVHHLGKRLRGSRDVQVWLGGKSMKVSKLLEIVSKKFNASPSEVKQLLRNLDDLIKTAIEESHQLSAKSSILQLVAPYKFRGSRRGISLQEFSERAHRRDRLHKFTVIENSRLLKPMETPKKIQRKPLRKGRSKSVDLGEISYYSNATAKH